MCGRMCMNEGGILSSCDCPCGCIKDSYSRWCLDCQVLHITLIRAQVTKEKDNEMS